MASKILIAAILASCALGRALPNSAEVATVEHAVKRTPQGGGGGGFDFGDYESQEDFWEEWQTEEAFFEEHASSFENEDDFWQQLEAALPSEGGSSEGGFSFGDYESQEDFWAEWQTEEEFFAAHGNLFESEDDFWTQLEAALPSEGGGEAEEGGAEEETGGGFGGGFPGFPGGDGEGGGFGGGEGGGFGGGEGGGFGGGEGGGFGGGFGGGAEEAPEEPVEREPIIVVGPIQD